jgi:phosphoribosylglycinamide formyltransferase 1
MSSARLAVLASGTGTNLQAILDACACGALDATVVSVVSDRCGARALERAQDAQVPMVRHLAPPERPTDAATRKQWDADLADLVAESNPDFVVLAGFMRVLSTAFLDRFPRRVVNLHPALPGELPGIRAIERAFAEYEAGLRTRTGAMVHFVEDEGVDNGQVILVTHVPIVSGDDLASLTDRMHAAEHALLLNAIDSLISATTTPARHQGADS